jgi:hypothetical protein
VKFLPAVFAIDPNPMNLASILPSQDHPHTGIIPILFRIAPGTLRITPIFVVIGSNQLRVRLLLIR